MGELGGQTANMSSWTFISLNPCRFESYSKHKSSLKNKERGAIPY